MQESQALLEFSGNDQQTGFRLKSFELYNWGTFNNQVWSINPAGDNALLTGDIGSGKSTVVDALTTLLVAPQQVTFNKAAGAEGKERNLRSYVLGFYKSEKEEYGIKAKAVGLRGNGSYSVLLSQFYNSGYEQALTIAQVFWIKPGKNSPERFYVVSDNLLNIKAHFSDFGNDISQLRRKLRNMEMVEVFDSFSQYSGAFRRRMGIETEQAMNLFFQTVSMKSVGNLTEFVRSHMLEGASIQGRIETIINSFDDLSRAHEAVLTAKNQIEQLQPLEAHYQEYQTIEQQITDLKKIHQHSDRFFSEKKLSLLQNRCEATEQLVEKLELKLMQQQDQLQHDRDQFSEVQQAILTSGGDRLLLLDKEIENIGERQEEVKFRAERYQSISEKLSFSPHLSIDQFIDNRHLAQEALDQISSEQAKFDQQRIEAEVNQKHLIEKSQKLETELSSLRGRRSNIPRRNLEVRQRICDALGLEENEIPFVGELVQVRDSQMQWQGAIERVLFGFGLSLLVPERHYAEVSDLIDRTHFGGRVVYYRVSKAKSSMMQPQSQSLFNKLEVKSDSEFYLWLEQELLSRYDYQCCEDLNDFRRSRRALSLNGQIKGGQRHEKNDSFDIKDSSRYILGWSNQQKVDSLLKQQMALAENFHSVQKLSSGFKKTLDQQSTRRQQLQQLLDYDQFESIDWLSISLRLQQLNEEKQTLEKSSDQLVELQSQLVNLQQQLRDGELERNNTLQEQAKLMNQLESDESEIERLGIYVDEVEQEKREIINADTEKSVQSWSTTALDLSNLEQSKNRFVQWLMEEQIQPIQKNEVVLREAMIGIMHHFKQNFRHDARALDTHINSLAEYLLRLDQLKKDDLPKHEQRFHELLKETAIHEMALLQQHLQKERAQISDKIEKINKSLNSLEYNEGTFINLIMQKNPDREICDFQADIKQCLNDGLQDEEQYSEEKFQRVKRLIDRFRGRENHSNEDQRWLQKVVDVRNWCVFSASERWREDDSEREHYSDSSGKSGGQKEKLAYTILASALAYQFGLEWGETRSHSFRFVMIDEAFGRGSDDSARYALKLFAGLNLQLLIVTPLQKIHVIEDYVRTVNYVHNQEGRNSMMRNLTIEQYREEKIQQALSST